MDRDVAYPLDSQGLSGMPSDADKQRCGGLRLRQVTFLFF
jgi:hypothetical protein